MEYNDPNNEQQTANTQQQFVADLVCPVCFRAIEHPVIMTEGADEVGRRLRTYFGYCAECSAAHVVIQFARGDRWVIHKFRPAVVVGLANVIEIVNDWKILSELPPPAKPEDGGLKTEDSNADYAEIKESLQKAHAEIMGLAITIKTLISHLAEERGQAIDD